MPFWSPITRDYLCGLAFRLMHSPLRYGPKCKGLKMRVYPVTFCSTFAIFQSKLKMFNNFVISLLYRDEQSCPWPLVYTITFWEIFKFESWTYVIRQILGFSRNRRPGKDEESMALLKKFEQKRSVKDCCDKIFLLLYLLSNIEEEILPLPLYLTSVF